MNTEAKTVAVVDYGMGNLRSVTKALEHVADGRATWVPAVDGHLMALIGTSTGFVAALLGTLAVLRRPPWPHLDK